MPRAEEPALIRGMPLSLLCLLAACVVSVAVSTEITEPVDRVEVSLSNGDLTVLAEPGNVYLEGDVGGVGEGTFDYDVVDRVLIVDATCGNELCGGSIDIKGPARLALTVKLTTGEIHVEGLRGDQNISVGTGSIQGIDLASSLYVGSVQLGDVDLDFAKAPDDLTISAGTGAVRIEVPAGAYDLDVVVGNGSINTPGIQRDSSASRHISVRVDHGDVHILGR